VNLHVDVVRKPYALKAHARFDEGGQARACSLLYQRERQVREMAQDTPLMRALGLAHHWPKPARAVFLRLSLSRSRAPEQAKKQTDSQ